MNLDIITNEIVAYVYQRGFCGQSLEYVKSKLVRLMSPIDRSAEEAEVVSLNTDGPSDGVAVITNGNIRIIETPQEIEGQLAIIEEQGPADEEVPEPHVMQPVSKSTAKRRKAQGA